MRLLTAFAIIALLLASIGVYGVLAYYVSNDTREIGVRAALGASRRQFATLVVRQSLLPILAGVLAGVAGSLASGRLLQQFLFEVNPGDPQVIGTIVAMLIGVGLLACWLPARRAAAIDPIVGVTGRVALCGRYHGVLHAVERDLAGRLIGARDRNLE